MAAKLKNLEQEVDMLISEDESDAVEKKRATRRSSRTATAAAVAATEKTPSRALQQKKPAGSDKTPQQPAGLQTPRRSTRKSIFPAQDYDDIVTKSAGKSASGQRDAHTDDEHSEAVARWTPAKVGRVSERRRGRSRKLAKKEKEPAGPNDSDAENVASEGNAKQAESAPEDKGSEQGEQVAAKNPGKRAKRTRAKKTADGKVAETKGAEPVGMDTSKTKEDLTGKEKEAPLEALEDKKRTAVAKDNENLEQAEEKAASATTEKEDVVMEGVKEVDVPVEEPLKIGKGALDGGDDANKEEPDAGDVDSKEGPGDVDTKEASAAGNIDAKKGPGAGNVDTNDASDPCEVDAKEGPDAPGPTTENEKVDTTSCKPAAGSPGPAKGSAESKALFDGNSSGAGHFGSYLQTHQEDLEDLGLNPLATTGDAGEEKPPTETYEDMPPAATETYEDMPTLRIDDVDEAPQSPNGTGDTFNLSDCIVVGDETPPAEGRSTPTSDVEMQPLQISDDEPDDEPPARPIPRIVIEEVDVAAKPTGPVAVEKTTGPVAAVRASLRRKPTPHKKRDTVSSELKALAREEANAPAVTIELPVTTLPPKQIVLQGIRKRSLSMSVGEAAKSSKGVRFHSPANQTMMCDEIDLKLARSAKKPKTADDEFVTQRRRRSKSAEEGATMRLKRLATPTRGKGEQPGNEKKIPRSKLPNFRAIHEKHFEQMENLLEHMRRKTERAQLLSNSATKQKPPRVEVAEDVAPRSQTKARLAIVPTVAATVDKPKAPTAAGRKALREPNVAAAASVKAAKTTKKPPFNLSTHLEGNRTLTAPLSVTLCATTTTTSVAEAAKQLNATSTAASGSRPISRIPVATATTTHNATLAHEDLVAARRKRHMDLFKGRSANARVGLGTNSRPAAIIRGVRSNRRFELQMQHRQNKMDPN